MVKKLDTLKKNLRKLSSAQENMEKSAGYTIETQEASIMDYKTDTSLWYSNDILE